MHLVERKSRAIPYLERFRPTEREQVKKFVDIDFDKYKQNGVTTLLLDAEGTFVEQDAWKVDAAIIDKIKGAGFEHVAIISNKKPRDERTFVKLNSWAKQIGADIVFTPTQPVERKPRPHLLLKALEHFDIKADQALMVGDKLTADIKAANAVGVDSVWVSRTGRRDLIGDRIIRRPAEVWMHQKLVNSQPSERTKPAVVYTRPEDRYKPAPPSWIHNVDTDLWENSRIANYGGVDVAPVSIKGLIRGRFPKVVDAYKAHVYKHGRMEADIVTDVASKMGYLEAGLMLTGHADVAKVISLPDSALDALDGPLARGHKDGATPEGGERDQEGDKERALARWAGGVLTGRLKPKHLLLRWGSDVAMNKVVRPYFKRRGVDVKANWAGKVSTPLNNVAEFSMLTDRNPEVIQQIATAAKVGRVVIYAAQWSHELKRKKVEDAAYQEAIAYLRAEEKSTA